MRHVVTKLRKSAKARPTKTKSERSAVAPSGAIVIPATKLYCRKMPEFKNCEAIAWAAVNETTGTVQYANLYNGKLTPKYNAVAYTFALKPKTQKKLDDGWHEIEVTEWPELFAQAPRKRARSK
jgi:hypothetical protein